MSDEAGSGRRDQSARAARKQGTVIKAIRLIKGLVLRAEFVRKR